MQVNGISRDLPFLDCDLGQGRTGADQIRSDLQTGATDWIAKPMHGPSNNNWWPQMQIGHFICMKSRIQLMGGG